MQIKSIEKVLKRTKTIIVMPQPAEDTLWFSDGGVCMPLYDFPALDRDNIFALFSIPEDKRSKWLYEERQLLPKYNLTDTDPTEELLDRGNIQFITYGNTVEPLYGAEGMLYVDSGYIRAFCAEDENIQFYSRKDTNGEPYIVAKSGMFLVGLIAPMTSILNEELANGMLYIANGLSAALRGRMAERDPEQLTLTEGAEKT